MIKIRKGEITFIVRKKIRFFLFFCFLCYPTLSWAHREDYIDETLVFQTLEKSDFEPEYWFDYGRDHKEAKDFLRHNLAAEYGITDHWMVDGRGTFKKNIGEDDHFDSGRLETRFRFSEEGELSVDVALSGEINVMRDEVGHHNYGLEPRLILSKDFGKLNTTVNLPLEIQWEHGEAKLLPAVGTRYDLSSLFRLGIELKYEGSSEGWSTLPQIWIALPRNITCKVGYSSSIGNKSESFFRSVIEAEF